MANMENNKHFLETDIFFALMGLMLNLSVIALTVGLLLYLYSLVAEIFIAGFIAISKTNGQIF
jgi:hypothetical protein